jgi:hypothetical protein
MTAGKLSWCSSGPSLRESISSVSPYRAVLKEFLLSKDTIAFGQLCSSI